MADFKEKTYVEDVDRSVYDIRDEEHDAYRMESGLTPEIVEKLSQEKSDPAWMQQFRLESLQIYNEMKLPNWGPSIEGLDMDHIATYVRPNTKMRNDWKDVPEDIKETFERLGIPQAERKSLAGVGAQYDSELVYHNVKDSVAAEGVVYTDMESAQKGEYADMVRKYFMKLVTPHDHKFAALHGAVWSGGSFVYVPKGVHLSIPLQSYFRLNAKGAGQFEHTLIIVDEGASLHFIEGCSAPKYNVANLHAGCVELYVKKGAKLRYSTIENWSKNMYNLNTKRALVEEGGVIEWVSGSFGSHVGCLYPMSILKGDNSRMEFTGVTFAGAGQDLDTGAKVVHVGKNTSSYMNARSISKSGGVSTFRSSVVVEKSAKGAKSAVSCQSLMLDSESRSDTIPAMDIKTRDAAVGHEARIGAISNDAVFYLMSRGMSEEDARRSLGKLSDTPFSLRALTVQTAGAFVPVSALNQLRREGCQQLAEARIVAFTRKAGREEPVDDLIYPDTPDAPSMAIVRTREQADAMQDAADLLVWYPEDFRADALESGLRDMPDGVWLQLPTVCEEKTLDLLYDFVQRNAGKLGGIVLGSVGQLGRTWNVPMGVVWPGPQTKAW